MLRCVLCLARSYTEHILRGNLEVTVTGQAEMPTITALIYHHHRRSSSSLVLNFNYTKLGKIYIIVYLCILIERQEKKRNESLISLKCLPIFFLPEFHVSLLSYQ
jgi:hypothetical protein